MTSNTAPAGPVFQQGDRVVCADGVARTVRAMAPLRTGEPTHVVVEDGTQWIAANCRRANPADLACARQASHATAARVRQDPDPGDPQWHAALADLTATHAYLRTAETSAAVLEGLARGRAEAARMAADLEGAPALAGDDEEERERRDMVNAQLTPEDEECTLREEIAAHFAVLSADGQAHGFEPVHVRGDACPIAWTYRTGYGSAVRHGWVLADGRTCSQPAAVEYRWQAEEAAADAACSMAGEPSALADAFTSMSLDDLRAALDRLRDRAARTRGTRPQHVLNEDVRAALDVLAACHRAEITQNFNPTAKEGTEGHDPSVAGLVVEPRENGHVTAYWVERGRYVTPEGDPFMAQLRDIRRQFTEAGWETVPGTVRVVTAYRPTV